MRLAVISDTHLDEPTPGFRRFFASELAGADAVVHCGDITGLSVLTYMQDNHPRVYAVAGNMCDWRTGQELPPTARLHLAGRTVGLAHGWGEKATLPERLAQAFGPGYDLILFGHTHKQAKLCVNGTLLVNPGSLSGDSPRMAFLTLGDTIDVDFRAYARAL